MKRILAFVILSLFLFNQPVWTKTHGSSKRASQTKSHTTKKKSSKKKSSKKGSEGSKSGKDGEFKVKSELGKNNVTFNFNEKDGKNQKTDK
jgi:hypothetical protein